MSSRSSRLRFPPIGDDERQAHSSGVVERARRAFAGKRLLVVDDDAAQRVTTRHKLQPLGVQVDQAADGQRALEALGRQRYDLVLLDLNMPVLDGYALAQRIRRGQVPANRDVRIVAYTSEPAHLASVKTRKAGMDGFVSKPCAQLPLLQALHHALDHPAWHDGPDPALAGRRVLVADDSPTNRKAVTAYLRHAGVTVEEAGHGREVLDHLQGPQRWDAVLMDINMPGMDGLETSQAIRAGARAWRDIPIIALTAHSDQRTVQAARSAGMNDFLTKPVDASVLYAKLGQLVGGQAAPLPPYSPFSRSAAAPATAGGLLDAERLESYRRMGMLEELLQDYVPEIARLVTRLEQSAAAQDLQATLDALHSLLGMSGEAGAQALCRMVRRIYVPMIEERAWPAAPGWASQVAELAAETELALKAYGSPRARGQPRLRSECGPDTPGARRPCLHPLRGRRTGFPQMVCPCLRRRIHRGHGRRRRRGAGRAGRTRPRVLGAGHRLPHARARRDEAAARGAARFSPPGAPAGDGLCRKRRWRSPP